MSNLDLVERFIEKAPFCVMAQAALERLLSAEALDQLFAEHAKVQYQRQLVFSSVARLMAGVVLGWDKSVNAAYKKCKEEIGASLNALYGKLDRMETGISQALVRFAYAQYCQVAPAGGGGDVPNFQTKILDGNHLAFSQHRLKETRDSSAAPLPGKSLVVLDAARRVIADLFPILDGHAQERSELDPVIETIQPRELWIADRNFCTLKFLYEIDRRQAKFVVRLHGQVHGKRIGPRHYMGRSETGRVFEQLFELPSYDGQTLTVRCIEIELFKATRDGDMVMSILTNLKPKEASALEVADTYRGRWTIETAFLHLTTTLHCEVDTLCYPKAALFNFSLACVAYNAVRLEFAAVQAEHGVEAEEELSFYYVGLEIAEMHGGMMIAIDENYWAEFKALSARSYFARLRAIARGIELDRYRKAKRGPKKGRPPRKYDRRHVHVSSEQLLAARKKSAC